MNAYAALVLLLAAVAVRADDGPDVVGAEGEGRTLGLIKKHLGPRQFGGYGGYGGYGGSSLLGGLFHNVFGGNPYYGPGYYGGYGPGYGYGGSPFIGGHPVNPYGHGGGFYPQGYGGGYQHFPGAPFKRETKDTFFETKDIDVDLNY